MGVFDKAKDALNSDKAEQVTDQGLDKAADAAKDQLGEDKHDKVDQVRDAADKKLGNE